MTRHKNFTSQEIDGWAFMAVRQPNSNVFALKQDHMRANTRKTLLVVSP